MFAEFCDPQVPMHNLFVFVFPFCLCLCVCICIRPMHSSTFVSFSDKNCQSLSFFGTCVCVCSWSMHHCLCLCLSFGSVFVFFFFIGPMHNCTCASLLDRMSLSLSLCSVDQCTIAQLHMCQPSRQDIGPRLRASPSSMSDPLPIKNIRFSQQASPPWILNFSCH